MSRDLDSTLAAALSDGLIMPCVLAQLAFVSETVYVWSGIGDLIYDSDTYIGVGALGSIGAISEGVAVRAEGTSLTLSGIAPGMLTEALSDIRIGGAAKIWFGLLSAGALIGTPYMIFSGTVDKPNVQVGAKTVSITLALENKLINLQRASQRRYTAADQHLEYPDDTGFNWVEILNDIALRWGS